MLTFKTILTLFKKYWKFALLIVVTVLGYLLFQRRNADLLRQVKEIQDQHDRELREIQRIHEEEIKKREENERIMQERLTIIQQQFVQAQKELDTEKKKAVEDLVKKYGDDPVEMAKRLSEVAGFEVVLPGEEK
jgi:DNA-binding transcriptional MerR regulator